MSTAEPPEPPGPFVDWLAACEQALAAGLAPPEPPDDDRADRLRGAGRVLARMERAWPRHTAENGAAVALEYNGLSFDLATGTGQLGRFRLLRELGRGGCGIVFLAADPLLRREVALKVPRLEALLTPSLRERFVREARAAARLQHPNLVPVYEAETAGAFCYLVSAYCPGPTLAEWLRAHGRAADPAVAATLTAALADGVAYMHDQGVVHRDLKPGNILLQPAGESADSVAPKITDFGLAKSLTADPALTASRGLLGTPAYMAPEQADGRRAEVGPAADVYALGVTLYELLTGRPPHQGESEADTLRLVVDAEPLPPRRLRPGLPADLEAVCLQCLEKEPARRYAGAADLAADLRRFLAGLPVRARPAGVVRRGMKWARRRPAAAALVAVSSLAALVLAAGAWSYDMQRRRHQLEFQAAAAEQDHLRHAQLYVRSIRLAERLAEDRKSELRGQLEWLRADPAAGGLLGFEWRYLRGLLDRGEDAVIATGRPLFAGTLSPDGKTLATATERGVLVWDVATKRLRGELGGHAYSVLALAFSPDGRYLISAGGGRREGEAKAWNFGPGGVLEALGRPAPAEARTIQDPGKPPGPDNWGSGVDVNAVAFSLDGAQLALTRINSPSLGWVQIWDVGESPWRRYRHGFEPPSGAPLSLIAGAGDRTLVCGSSDGSLCCWDLEARRLAWHAARAHAGAVLCLARSPDGRFLASGGADKSIYLWDARTGAWVQTLSGSPAAVWSLAFSPDGEMVAAGHADGSVRFWDRRTGRQHRYYLTHPPTVRLLLFSRDGMTLVSGSQNGTLRFSDWTGARACLGHDREAWCVTFAPDSQTLVSAGDDNVARVWDAASGKLRSVLRGHGSLVSCAAFSPDGTTLATGSYDHTIRLWDRAAESPRATLRGHTAAVRCLAVSPDGSLLATGSRDRSIKLWDLRTGEERHTLAGHTDRVRALVFSPDGRTLVSGGEDGSLRVWDVVTGAQRDVSHSRDEVWSLAISPDGRTLAQGNRSGALILWDVPSWRSRAVTDGHARGIRSLAFTPDGRTLAAGSEDQTIGLWHTETGERLLTLRGHAHAVNGVAFAPDGKTLASACHDGAVWLWPGE